MSKSLQAYFSFLITIALASGITAIQLPYEVFDSIIELSDIDDYRNLNQVNVSDDLGPTRPIYRLDLNPDYVAYYEIDIGSDYVVFSSGRETGDFREVESGPDPRPTNLLIQQAQENGQQCEKFYRLSPLGLTICKNDNGTVVAASYNWTADVAEIEDWLQLDQMVRDSVDNFKRMWRERVAHRRSQTDWVTTEVLTKGGKSFKKEIDEKVLMPGSIVKVALGERVRSVGVYIKSGGNTRMRPKSRSEWQRKLCKVLVDVCLLNGSSKVNPSAIKETTNHLSYLQLEVHGNRTFVGNTLQWREIGFVIEIKGRENELVKKYFAINLHSQRFRRSSCSKFCTGSVSGESSNFPDYDQHRCCGDCWSGCGPVAWAQVFGYYDRLAHRFYSSKFSSSLFKDRYIMAPLKMTYAVQRFVEDIRLQVETYCTSTGEGSTYTKKMHLIAPWFRARQGYRSRVVSYLERRKKRSVGGARREYGSRSWIQSKGVEWLKKDYPVVFSFPVEDGGHSAVATKYREKVRSYRHCTSRQTGWWWWKKTKSACSWRRAYNYEFYLHYGWGGSNNGWRTINPWGAHVAYLD